VKGRLYQTNSGGTALARAIHHRLHQLTASPEVLCAGVDGDRAETSDHGTLVKDIATHNRAIDFRYHAVEAWAGKQHREQAGRNLCPGEIARETVS
jgi:hypothetical protein